MVCYLWRSSKYGNSGQNHRILAAVVITTPGPPSKAPIGEAGFFMMDHKIKPEPNLIEGHLNLEAHGTQ